MTTLWEGRSFVVIPALAPGGYRIRPYTGSKERAGSKGSPLSRELAAEPPEGLLTQMFQEKNEKAIPSVRFAYHLPLHKGGMERRIPRGGQYANSILLTPLICRLRRHLPLRGKNIRCVRPTGGKLARRSRDG